ncbi:hypothetical protein PV721_28825 [Streptomyces sp. MB09-01]|uniref:alpha/beta fold hydrolase n=1 Tax=Streptomyces sp. MB09-01 TaxID=3028666 RepID=UPI0029B9A49B|nr:hypothetical protein [Streptomyces sp. MB09-01]MDX3538282.1 hypothetical protein [Streptomyces sp. MB09-01]
MRIAVEVVAEFRSGFAEAADGLAHGPGPFGGVAGAPVASAGPDGPCEFVDRSAEWNRNAAGPCSTSACPGSVEQAVKDADTFFGVELPAPADWRFGPGNAAAIRRPVLSVLGSGTRPLWVEVAAFLRSHVPGIEEYVVDGVGHLPHIERPRPVAEEPARFLARHPIAS